MRSYDGYMRVALLTCAIFVSLGLSDLCAREIVVGSSSEIVKAIANASPGDTIYILGGRYFFDRRIEIKNSGLADKRIALWSFPGDSIRPLFDFSQMEEKSSNQGIRLSANYWHIKGVDVYRAGDNGLLISGGSRNIIEFCSFVACSDSGLQLDGGASENLILNCDSYYNADSKKENADGFACKTDVGSGNTFRGCRAWQNLDDGWDGYLRDTDGVTTRYENCWAFRNGYLADGTRGYGDGNGFKTGGSDEKRLKHHAIYINCVAAGNAAEGFDHNSNRGNVTLLNCSMHGNKTNLGFGGENPVGILTIKNSIVLGPLGKLKADSVVASHNSWQSGFACEEGDFLSVDMSQLTRPRKADGSLPDIEYLHLAKESRLIDAGLDVGLPYSGAAPDLGAFEYQGENEF